MSPREGRATFATRWEAFWHAPTDAAPLRWIRVAVAAVALFYALEFFPLLGDYYVSGGRFPIAEARAVSRGQAISLLFLPGLDAPAAVGALYAALLLSLGAVLAGWRVRGSVPAAFLLLLWFQMRVPLYLDGGDEVLRFALLYLAVCAVAFPAAVGRAPGPDGSPTVPVWTLRLFQIQVALMYFLSGYWKVTGAPWWDGSAVWVAIANPSFARFDVPAALGFQPLFLAAGIAVAWWEFLFPALVAWGRTRGWTLAFGVALHLGILLTMNIGLFPLAVLATYPAFVSADRLSAVEGRLGRIAARARALPSGGAR